MANKRASPKKASRGPQPFPKTKMFGKEQFRLKEQKANRTLADKSASASRDKNKKARVIPKKSATGSGNDKTFGVYTRNK